MTDYRPRALAPLVRHALTQMPVVVVTGLRQSGKSTFLQKETGLRNRLYRTLDDLNQLEAALSYWHIQGRHEVDFVIESRRGVLALEVKASKRWSERDLAGLQAFQRDTPRCRAAVLAYAGGEIVQLGEKLWAIPLGVVLS